MSLPVKDFRGGITPLSHAVLSSIAEANHMDIQELVRDVLHKFALKQVRACSLMQKALKANGLDADSDGTDSEFEQGSAEYWRAKYLKAAGK
jgi:hypothetical protein